MPASQDLRGARKKGGGRFQLALIVLLALASAALLSYPYISNWLYRQAQLSVSNEQAQAVSQADPADLEHEREAARAYNQRLLDGATRVSDPFSPANIEGAGPQEYWALLNIAGDGVMGTVVVPRVNIQTPIYHGTEASTLEQGAGHVENTSLPVGGPSTHAVIAGHNGLPSVRIFDALEDVRAGDYFIIQVLGEDLAYRVYDVETVLPDETGSLLVQRDRDLVTLVTCTPYGVNDHRLLVHGERCDVPQDWLDRQASPGGTGALGLAPFFDWLPVAGGALVAAVLVGAFAAVRRRRRR